MLYTYHTIFELDNEICHYFGKRKNNLNRPCHNYFGSGSVFKNNENIKILEVIVLNTYETMEELSIAEEKLIKLGKAQFGVRCKNIQEHSVVNIVTEEEKNAASEKTKLMWENTKIKDIIKNKHLENWSDPEYKKRMLSYRDYSKVKESLRKHFEKTAEARAELRKIKAKEKTEERIRNREIRRIESAKRKAAKAWESHVKRETKRKLKNMSPSLKLFLDIV